MNITFIIDFLVLLIVCFNSEVYTNEKILAYIEKKYLFIDEKLSCQSDFISWSQNLNMGTKALIFLVINLT